MPSVESAEVHRLPIEGDHVTHPHECPSCQEPFDCSSKDCVPHYEVYCVTCYDVAVADAGIANEE